MKDSYNLLFFRMAELELDPQERVLCFAQLLGMCDQITFPLGEKLILSSKFYL